MNAHIELISLSEYARRRGCAKSAVSKAVAEGRISTIEGRIDPVVANIQWAKNTRARADSSRGAEGQCAPTDAAALDSIRQLRDRVDAMDATLRARASAVQNDVAICDAFRVLRDRVVNSALDFLVSHEVELAMARAMREVFDLFERDDLVELRRKVAR